MPPVPSHSPTQDFNFFLLEIPTGIPWVAFNVQSGMQWKPRCSGHLGSWHPWHHLDLGTTAGWCAWLTPTPSGVAQWVPPRDGPSMPKSNLPPGLIAYRNLQGNHVILASLCFCSASSRSLRSRLPGDQNLEWQDSQEKDLCTSCKGCSCSDVRANGVNKAIL